MISVCVSRNIKRYQEHKVFKQPLVLNHPVVVAVTFYKNGVMSHKPFLVCVPPGPFHIGFTGLPAPNPFTVTAVLIPDDACKELLEDQEEAEHGSDSFGDAGHDEKRNGHDEKKKCSIQ